VPRVVDHEQRRREVTEAGTRLLAAHGRAALTVRRVADAVGCSTTVVSHYFTDMDDLLYEVYTAAAERARARLDAMAAADPADLQGLIEALLPLDAAREQDWRVWFAFWSEALHVERFGLDQRSRARTTTQRLAKVMKGLAAAGRLDPECDIPNAARRLGALIPGIAAQVVFDPAGWTPVRQRAVLAGELAMLGVR
jgi:AcrR family transcriptional regulator